MRKIDKQAGIQAAKYQMKLPWPSLYPALGAILLVLLTPAAQAGNEACIAHLTSHQSDTDATLRHELSQYQPLIEESLVYRNLSIAVAEKLKHRLQRGLPLSGADLHTLNEGLIAHLALRKKLYRFAHMHECWMEIDDNTIAELKLSQQHRLYGIMISLSAALTLYDNYLLAISIFEEDDKLRRFLNSHDKGYNKQYDALAAVTQSYNSIDNRSRVRNAIHFFEQSSSLFKQYESADDFSYLALLIKQSPSYNLTRSYAPLRVLGSKLRFLDAITNDKLATLRDEGINVFSMLFGNTVGLIESRKGKLYSKLKITNKVREKLQAGDILLEKTPFRLTDKFIPGHWGHAAIWIGKEQELRALGIWGHPLVQKHHALIKQGKSVVEALRNGVVLNPLEKFMNIDDLSVLRLARAKPTEKAQIILMALRQVDKAYDFNFDIESTDRIVCSELIYIAYTGIDWPTDNTLGRYTISPDNIALKALHEGPLDLIMLIHDGKIIKQKPKQFMAKLLENSRTK